MSKATSYLYNLLNHYEEYRDSSKETKMKDRLKMADTLISKYGADPNQNEIICEAAERGNLKVLELFAKYKVNFNNCDINIHEVNTPDHADILQFLRNHGYNGNVPSWNTLRVPNPLMARNGTIYQAQNLTQHQPSNQMNITKFFNKK